jgi:hypothetical protein
MQDGITHVPSGLFTVGVGEHALSSVIKCLYTAHQANPLVESLYLVTNALNHDEYAGPAGFFDDVGRFPRDWQDQHVLCNGCSRPDAWGGHVADLAMAMERMGRDARARDVIAIDGNVFLWPDFNLQVCLFIDE